MKRRINLQLTCIAIVAIAATVIGLTMVYYGIFQSRVRNDLRTSANLIKDTQYFESLDMDYKSIDFSTDINDLRVTWIASDGTVLYDNDTDADVLENHSDRPEIIEAFESGEGESVRHSNTMNRNTFYYALLLDNGTVLRVSTDAESIVSILFSSAPFIIGTLVVIILLCVGLSKILTKQLIKPIETMAKNMEESNDDLTYKELRPFVEMIRQQHADILSAAKARQDFTANVSHELKTPLTAISGYAELIQNKMVDPSQEDHFITEIRKNAERLLSLINDIIRLSELDRSEKEPSFETLDLYDVVSECMDALTVNAEKRNISLEFTGSHCNITGNREMIHELTDNLVQNAIRYNKEGGQVKVTIDCVDGIKFVVWDNGIGIPKEDQKRVFERFYRVDKSRSKETGGTGLGLAIVKHIVELHDAKIDLKSKIGEGTEITVTF